MLAASAKHELFSTPPKVERQSTTSCSRFLNRRAWAWQPWHWLASGCDVDAVLPNPVERSGSEPTCSGSLEKTNTTVLTLQRFRLSLTQQGWFHLTCTPLANYSFIDAHDALATTTNSACGISVSVVASPQRFSRLDSCVPRLRLPFVVVRYRVPNERYGERSILS